MIAEDRPHVQGACPACGQRGLFLDGHGYVVCRQLGCGSPTAASDGLQFEPERHWLEWLVEIGYGVDWRNEADPPCDLNDLADVYAYGPRPSDETAAVWASMIEQGGKWNGGRS